MSGFAAGQHGRLVQPENVEELAVALVLQAKQSPFGMDERRALHRRVASHFSLDQLSRKVLDYYLDLVQRRR